MKHNEVGKSATGGCKNLGRDQCPVYGSTIQCSAQCTLCTVRGTESKYSTAVPVQLSALRCSGIFAGQYIAYGGVGLRHSAQLDSSPSWKEKELKATDSVEERPALSDETSTFLGRIHRYEILVSLIKDCGRS